MNRETVASARLACVGSDAVWRFSGYALTGTLPTSFAAA
jgi:hypothetical protein